MGCPTNIVPGYTDTSKIKNKPLEMKLEKEFAYHKTQIPTTISTYRQVAKEHFGSIPPSDVLDFGAGLGVGTREFGFDSYEPFPQRGLEKYGWTPDYTEPGRLIKSIKD